MGFAWVHSATSGVRRVYSGLRVLNSAPLVVSRVHSGSRGITHALILDVVFIRVFAFLGVNSSSHGFIPACLVVVGFNLVRMASLERA